MGEEKLISEIKSVSDLGVFNVFLEMAPQKAITTIVTKHKAQVAKCLKQEFSKMENVPQITKLLDALIKHKDALVG